MRLSRSLDGLTLLGLAFWLQEAGTKRSRYVRPPGPSAPHTKVFQYWDLRTPNPVASVTLPDRCYTFDIQYPLMVVGTAERHIQIFTLTNPGTAFKVRTLTTIVTPTNVL
jgi:hypothetical protein